MRYILNKNANIEEMVDELNNIEGINARVEEVEVDDPNVLDEVQIIIKSKAVQMELERILILLEEQGEVEIAIQKLHELYDLFDKLKEGLFEFEI